MIQSELNVPKNLENKFAGYKYRSCEGILEAVKPLLEKHECFMYITDCIEMVGDRIYIVATVRIKDKDGVETESKGYAREPLNKKGQDESQITGAASSYARKYALNGLFLIDDTKDADTQDNSDKEGNQSNQQKAESITKGQFNDFYSAWNGIIYKGDAVYWNDTKYQLSKEQSEWLKGQTKYKDK